MEKTKWQQLLDAPKGYTEYNPKQSFALQVFWVVRSPTAAAEMINQGFIPCAKATMRDTPTTLAYIFRISRDQRLAVKLKSEIRTIGQHPHYLPAFKSINMGIPQFNIETKLKHGGIPSAPLSWGPDAPISGHELEIDFDPVVLECTEVYLDDRSFYEHSASHEWMKSSPEILKAVRSLKPATICLGTPSADIWTKCLDPSLKAIRFSTEDSKEMKELQPGVFFCLPLTQNNSNNSDNNANNNNNDKNNQMREGDAHIFFLEMDLVMHKDKIQTCRAHLSSIQQELAAPMMMVFPSLVQNDNEPDLFEVRAMLSFSYSTGMNTCSNFKPLTVDCKQIEGSIIVEAEREVDQQRNHDVAQHFLNLSGLNTAKISIVDGQQARKNSTMAGYPLHPLAHQLTSNEKLAYKI